MDKSSISSRKRPGIANVKKLLLRLLSDRPIAYHPALAGLVGGAAPALFLSQLLYWSDKGNDPSGWIYKTRNDWQEETGLTRYEQETARRKLRETGIVTEKLAGVPATLHYRIDFDALIEQAQSSWGKTTQLVGGKPPNKTGENHPTIPEITPETTQFFPAPESRASAAEPETIPVDAEGDPLDEYHRGSRPKWQCPETVFQREFLGVCRAKWFKPKQKTKVKKLAKCLDVGDVLGDGVYQRCLDELKDCESFPDRPLAMPRSWYEWRAGHARSNRWSVDGFINALFDRDALVRHCQMHLKRRGVPAIELVEDKDAPVVMLGGK